MPASPLRLINVQEKRRRRNYVPPFLPPIFSPRSCRAYSLRSQRILLTYLFIVRNGNLNFVLYVIFELVVVFKFKSKGVFRCGVLMRVADRRSDRHGWMEVAANGGRQLSRVLARVVIDGCAAGEGKGGSFVVESWARPGSVQPVRVRRYRGPASALPSAIPPYINSRPNGFFPSVVASRCGEEKSYFTVPIRVGISSAYMYIYMYTRLPPSPFIHDPPSSASV